MCDSKPPAQDSSKAPWFAVRVNTKQETCSQRQPASSPASLPAAVSSAPWPCGYIHEEGVLLPTSPGILGWESQICEDSPHLPQELLLGGESCTGCGKVGLDPAGFTSSGSLSLLFLPSFHSFNIKNSRPKGRSGKLPSHTLHCRTPPEIHLDREALREALNQRRLPHCPPLSPHLPPLPWVE